MRRHRDFKPTAAVADLGGDGVELQNAPGMKRHLQAAGANRHNAHQVPCALKRLWILPVVYRKQQIAHICDSSSERRHEPAHEITTQTTREHHTTP